MREKDWSKVKWSPHKKPEDKDTTFDMRCKMSFKRRIRKLAEKLNTSQAEVIRRAVVSLEERQKGNYESITCWK